MTYLIITPIKEFWPKQGPAVLMGPWILSAFKEDQGNDVHYNQMLPCPWKNYDEVEKAYFFAQESYKLILPYLAKALNNIHNVNYPERYWQILIGPWLNWFVHVILDRVIRLQLAKDQFSDLKIKGLSSSSFIIPNNTLDFINLIKNDVYNLQIITRISEKMHISTEYSHEEKKENNLNKKCENNFYSKKRFRSKTLRLYHNIHIKLMKYFKVNSILYKTYHPKFFLIKLTIIGMCKIIDRLDVQDQTQIAEINLSLRDVLEKYLIDNFSSLLKHPFQKIILSLIAKEIPVVFLEGFLNLATFSEREFSIRSPKIIYSAIGWYFDEPFKYWSAQATNKGTKLCGLQHGGNYGISTILYAEDHEMKITDKYITWGWKKSKTHSSVISSSAQKLLDIKSLYLSVNKKKIIFVGSSSSRYLIYFPQIPEFFIQYLDWQKRFFKVISSDTSAQISIRLHYEDNGWKMKERLTELSNQLTFETWDIPFQESLYNCKLFICDHLSTTYVEALASNVPTILFWDRKINLIRSEVEPFFEDFRKVGILHDTPESAAAWLEKIYPDVFSWWNDEKCQHAVANFCNNYARTSKTPLRHWLKIFKNINEKN